MELNPEGETSNQFNSLNIRVNLGPSDEVFYISQFVHVRCATIVVKILFLPARGRNGTANHAKRRERKMKIFNEKLTKVGAGGSPDPVFRRMAVRMRGEREEKE